MNDPLRKYRRRFRAWKNTYSLKRELRRYNALFDAKKLSVPNERTIRNRIKLTFPGLKPKLRGNLNILAIYHHYNWENESLKPALEKFGAVRHYDWFERFNHQRKDWYSSVREEMNRDLIDRVTEWVRKEPFDVIFAYLSGEIVTPETVRRISALGIPTLNMSLNDKEAFVGKVKNGQAMGMRDICRYFTICWTSTEDAIKEYCVEGALPIYLPEGANPDVHKPYDIEKDIDVSFVGQCYGYRPQIIQGLKSEGLHVEAYGYGWPNGPLSSEEMVRIYSRSKISLGFGGVAGHKDTYCLKGRDFEVPMSGGLYVTEYHPELENCYDLGTEIVTYTGFDDLISKTRYFLSNDEEAGMIRKRGFQRARKEHTWEMRFVKIFGLMGLI